MIYALCAVKVSARGYIVRHLQEKLFAADVEVQAIENFIHNLKNPQSEWQSSWLYASLNPWIRS